VAGAEIVGIPLAADTRVVTDRVTLSDPLVRPMPERERLTVSMAFPATTGMPAGNLCLAPGRWEGRLHTALAPEIAPCGLAVDFAAESAELRRADGSAGLLTAATRLLAERLVLPRLEWVQVPFGVRARTRDG